MRTITIGDIHGRSVWKQIPNSDFDKIIFLGDYVDSFNETNNQIVENLIDIIYFKKQNPDKVVLLLGNHDLSYFISGFRCSGYRHDVASKIKSIFEQYASEFVLSYQIKNYLWTHSGVETRWFERHYGWFVDNGFTGDNYSKCLNLLLSSQTGLDMLSQIGKKRYGSFPTGSPIWADISELLGYNLSIPENLHQIVGHNRVSNITSYEDSHKDCSITFVDCLDSFENSVSFSPIDRTFYILDI